MKKFMFRYAILLLGLIGVSVINNVVMLRFKPLAFYYTPTGLMISAIVMGLESLILHPAVMWYIQKFIVTAGVKEENDEES